MARDHPGAGPSTRRRSTGGRVPLWRVVALVAWFSAAGGAAVAALRARLRAAPFVVGPLVRRVVAGRGWRGVALPRVSGWLPRRVPAPQRVGERVGRAGVCPVRRRAHALGSKGHAQVVAPPPDKPAAVPRPYGRVGPLAEPVAAVGPPVAVGRALEEAEEAQVSVAAPEFRERVRAGLEQFYASPPEVAP